MMITAIWIPPSLCGCQLQMTADFTDGSVVDGISYRHPKDAIKDKDATPITNLRIISACAAHLPQTLTMIDTSVFFDSDPINGGRKQNRGYLRYPIANPTSAECLYTFLSQYGGQTNSFPCGCKGHQFVDEHQNVTSLPHPVVTQKCQKHLNDTPEMAQAKLDFDITVKNSKTVKVKA